MNARVRVSGGRAASSPARAWSLTPARGGLLQRQCACGGAASGFGGKCGACEASRFGARPMGAGRGASRESAALSSPAAAHGSEDLGVSGVSAETLQGKLTVGRAGDVYEREADRVAEHVLRMPEPTEDASPDPHPTRGAAAETGLLQRACAKCDEEEEEVQRSEAGAHEAGEASMSAGGAAVSSGLSSRIEGLRKGGGSPLPGGVREYFEPRFGHDFSRVRVHADGRAAETARHLDAHAYTVGRDIVFGAGRYAPETAEGRRLLAHELTHVVQQSGASSSRPGRIQRQDKAGKPAAPPAKEEPWVRDSDGGLYYKTEEEAQRRMSALKEQGDYKEYRVVSFKLKEKTFWRVEMRGPQAPKKPEKAPEKKEGSDKAPADKKGSPAEGAREGEGKGEAPGDKKKEETPKKEETAEKGEKSAAKKVCLTFDDGPQPGTKEVLDVLDAKGAVATFFLTGKNMASDPTTQAALVKRIMKTHQIGNHTFTHDPMREFKKDEVLGYRETYGDLTDPKRLKKFQENYTKNEEHFKKLMGAGFPGFKFARLPGQGSLIKIDGKLVYVIATEAMGMTHFGWQFEFAPNGVFGHLKVQDWQGVTGAAAEVAALPGGNSIVLFHDRHWGSKKSVLEGIVSKLKEKSYSFGKLSASGKCG